METQELSNTDPRSQKELTPAGKTIDFPVTDGGRVIIGRVQYEPNQRLIQNKDLATGIIYLIETGGKRYSEVDIWAFRQACKRHKVTCQEIIDAYWLAYSDPYVSRETGIQFRHLWKHIHKMRGGDKPAYTFEQMLKKIDDEGLPQECFEQVEETDARGWKKWRLK